MSLAHSGTHQCHAEGAAGRGSTCSARTLYRHAGTHPYWCCWRGHAPLTPGQALAHSPAQHPQAPKQNQTILVKPETCWCQCWVLPALLVFCAGVVFPCPPESTSVPEKPLAGPGSRGDEQLSGDLTPSVHISCLGWTWSDHGGKIRQSGNKPCTQKGDFFQLHWCSSEPPDVACAWKRSPFPPREESCLHFPEPYNGSRAAWPLELRQLILVLPWPVPLALGKPRLQLLRGKTRPVDNRSSLLPLHTARCVILYMLSI